MDKEVQERVEIVRQRIAEWLRTFQQPTWIPRVNVEPGDAGPLASKYAGIPWLAEGESWPVCGSCHRPMEFFLQVNLSELPDDAQKRFGTGVLQLFYCLNAGITGDGRCACEGFEYFAECHLVRIVQPTGAISTASLPPNVGRFEPHAIMGWDSIDDYPHSDDFALLGLSCRYTTRKRNLFQLDCPAAGVVAEVFPSDAEYSFYEFDDEGIGAHSVEKLGGWPWWMQHEDYPLCPICQTRMVMVFQTWADLKFIEPLADRYRSENFVLGDLGIGKIMQCPTHRDVLTFGWQCH